VFDRCCTNTNHCKNFGTDNYQTKVLDSCTHLRNLLKKNACRNGMCQLLGAGWAWGDLGREFRYR
jgi:hypothetical protein